MSLVGHGRLGLRSGIRAFEELREQSHSTKDVFVRLRPITTLDSTLWAISSGTTYVAPFNYVVDGIRYDVVYMRSTLDTGLTRVNSLAECIATAGTFYYDPDASFGQEYVLWDQAGQNWDISPEQYWDQTPQLYVHMADNSNPANATVVAGIGFYFSGAGNLRSGQPQVHPALSEDLLTYGTFEDWTTADGLSTPDGWTLSWDGLPYWDDAATSWDDAGAYWDPQSQVITQDTSDYKVGTSSVKLDVIGSSFRELQATLSSTFRTDKFVRMSGWYKTEGDADAQIGVMEDSVGCLIDDGRHLGSTSSRLTLNRTGGEWRRFLFDFLPTAASLVFILKALGDGGTSGTVRFDDVLVRHIWRFNWYEPRISSSSLPSIDTSSNDIFFGGKSIGIGAISLLNHDGLIERIAADLEWMNQDVHVDVGGQFNDDEPVPTDNWFRGFTGLVQNLTVNDREVSFDLQDQRVFFHIKLPPRLYDDTVFTTMDLRGQGKERPLLFGPKENITPFRIIEDASTGYGSYEICDTQLSPNGIKAVDTVYAYLTKEDADTQRSDRRIELTEGTDYTVDLANAQFSIDLDVGPYQINDRDRRMDFDIGGGEITAVLDSGFYTAAELAAEIQTQMRAVGATDENCTYSETTHKFTISKDAGTLSLLVKTGTNAGSSPWFALGFDKGSDKTGSLSYTSADPVFEDVDKDHIIRVDAQGYKDDASGTYTGTANALVETGADICRVLLNKYMKKDLSVIDEASFVFSRQRAAEVLSLFIDESTSTKDIFDRLEFSNIANIVVNGEGKVFYQVYVGDVPDDIVIVTDSDIESFESSKGNSEVFTTIRVKYDRDPTSGNFEAREATDETVSLRLGRPDIKEFETYIKIADNAQSAANRMLELSRSAARKISMTTLGHKMLELEVGDKFQLTRRRALARSGSVTDEVFRIISISKNPLQGRVSVTATDDRVTVASIACVTTCQQFCETTCQQTCEQACQGECQLDCQDSCESACQVTCEQGCQESCQLGCQDTCETTCQGTCELSCQTGCQGPNCQTECETTCQGCAQTTCQTVCQADCQGACQLGCQVGCEVSCQTECQVSCQTACQTGCQTTCEIGCQTGCQITCQTSCQITGCQAASEAV